MLHLRALALLYVMFLAAACASPDGRDGAVEAAAFDTSTEGVSFDATATDREAPLDQSTTDQVAGRDLEDGVSAPRDATADATPTPDATMIDGSGVDTRPPENCTLAEGIAAQWVYPSGRTGSLCAPFRAGVIAFDTINCRPRLTSASSMLPRISYVYFDAMGHFFARLGPAMGAFVVDDLGTDCAMPHLENTLCRYRRQDYMCRMDVTRAGGPGDLVEAVLTAPCRLLHDYGGPVTEVTLLSARIRGRLVYGGDVAFASGDAGAPDCGIGP